MVFAKVDSCGLIRAKSKATDERLSEASVRRGVLESGGWVKCGLLPANELPEDEIISMIEEATSKKLYEVKEGEDGAKIRALSAEWQHDVAEVFDEKPTTPDYNLLAISVTVPVEAADLPKDSAEDDVVPTACGTPPQIIAPPPGLDISNRLMSAPPCPSPTGTMQAEQDRRSCFQSVKSEMHASDLARSDFGLSDGSVADVNVQHSDMSFERDGDLGEPLRSGASRVDAVVQTDPHEVAVVEVVSFEGGVGSVSECEPLKCANPKCRYLVHSSSDGSWPFCCGRCWCRYTGVMRGRVAHGEFCERFEAGPGAVAAQYKPTEEDLAIVAEAEEWRRVERLKALTRNTAESADVVQKSLPQDVPTPQGFLERADPRMSLPCGSSGGTRSEGATATQSARSPPQGVPAPPAKRSPPPPPSPRSRPSPPCSLPCGRPSAADSRQLSSARAPPPPPQTPWRIWETEAPPSVAEIRGLWAEPASPVGSWRNSMTIPSNSSPPPPPRAQAQCIGEIPAVPPPPVGHPPGLLLGRAATPPPPPSQPPGQYGDRAPRWLQASSPLKAHVPPPPMRTGLLPPPPPKGKPKTRGGLAYPEVSRTHEAPVMHDASIVSVHPPKSDVEFRLNGDAYMSCRFSGETSASTRSGIACCSRQDGNRYSAVVGVNKIPRRQTCASARWLSEL